MVWADDKDGPFQLYAQTFDQKLSPISPRVRLTNDTANAYSPAVAPTSDGGLGVMYESGQGVPPNDADAIKWYRKAAEQDDAVAQQLERTGPTERPDLVDERPLQRRLLMALDRTRLRDRDFFWIHAALEFKNASFHRSRMDMSM